MISLHIRRSTKWEQTLILIYMICVIICIIVSPSLYRKTMTYYMSVVSLSLLFVRIASLIENIKISKILFWIGFAIFGSIMAFRDGTGLDDWNYQVMFRDAADRTLLSYLYFRVEEKGYLLLNYLLYKITNGNYKIAQTIITYITFVFWGEAIWAKEGVMKQIMPLEMLLLWTHYYLLIMGAALVRIFMAIPIVFIAMKQLVNGNHKRCILLIIVASLFHLSALIMLLMVFFIISRNVFYKHWMIFIIVCSIIVPISFVFISRYIVPLLGNIKYSGYGNIGRFSIDIGSVSLLPIFVIGFIFHKNIDVKNRNMFIISMILIALSIIFEIFDSVVKLGRVVYYSNIGIIIGIPLMQSVNKKGFIEQVFLTLLVVYVFLYMMHVSVFNASHLKNLFPYRSFFMTI